MEINSLLKETLELINLGKLKLALEKINKTKIEDPNIFFLRGSIYLNLKQINLAEKNLKLAANLDENNHSIFHNLAVLYVAKKDIELAKINYKKALQIKNNTVSNIELANIYIDEKNYEEAQKYLEIALKIDNQNKKVLLDIGRLFMIKRDYKKAYHFINKANGLIRFTEKGIETIS